MKASLSFFMFLVSLFAARNLIKGLKGLKATVHIPLETFYGTRPILI